MRGAGALATGGAGGRGGVTGGAADDALIGGAAGAGGATLTGGGGGVGRGGSGMGGGTTTGFSTTGAATTERDGAGATTGGGGASFGGASGATTGLAMMGGGGAGRAGGAAASFCCVIAFSTSPGREMCDKSILVLISSSPRAGRVLGAVAGASAAPRMWARTFSASCSSRELECVFFSVTPTSGSTSRMALLLTSSSLARSLIRTLLIRPFLYSVFALSLHRSLTEFSF